MTEVMKNADILTSLGRRQRSKDNADDDDNSDERDLRSKAAFVRGRSCTEAAQNEKTEIYEAEQVSVSSMHYTCAFILTGDKVTHNARRCLSPTHHMLASILFYGEHIPSTK